MLTDVSYPPLPEPLAVPVADSHCHLDHGRGGDRPPSVDEALAAAQSVGVHTLVQIGCELQSARWSVEVARSYDDIWAGVSLHPNEAPRLAADPEQDLEAAYDEIEALAANSQVVAVGETGLDYFRTGVEGRAVQQESFRRHIAIAKQYDKALVIHDRDAHDDVLRILADEGAPNRVVMHCYSGDAAMARVCADRGYYLSFAGTVTFRNAAPLRNALVVTPLERLLVETDAPYLTPEPYRGRPNASYLIPTTVRAMAAARGMPENDLAAALMINTGRAFGRG